MGFRMWLLEHYWQEMLMEASTVTAALKEKANFELQMAGAKHGAPNGAAPPTKQ